MCDSVLLVNPFIYDLTAFDFWAKPIGLLEIGLLLKKLGLHVDLIDCMYSSDTNMAEFSKSQNNITPPKKKTFGSGTYFKEQIKKPEYLNSIPRNYYRFGLHPEVLKSKLNNLSVKPDLIFITGIMTYWWESLRDTICIIKEIYPDIPIVLGGIYPTLIPDHAKQFSGADFVVEGTVDINYLSDFIKKIKPDFKFDTSTTPSPLYYPYSNARYGIVRTSDGCPRKCTYCASSIIRKNYIEHDIDIVFGQISYLYNRGIKNIAFYDDYLLYNKKNRLFPLLRKIQDQDLQINLLAPNGLFLNHIDKETADILKLNNFTTLRFGFETAVEKISKRIGYKIGENDFETKINTLFQAGFKSSDIIIYIMVGLTGQNIKDVEDTIKFVRKYDLRLCLSEFSPVPRTPEFYKALPESKLDFEKYPQYQNNTILPLRSKVFTHQVLNDLKLMCHQ
ncbi:radical SAM protein [bacterium]|nr:radical SAM protein [bacterium]